jgi:S1-C subfamily serine protease
LFPYSFSILFVGVSGNTPRILRCVWLLCVLDSETKFLSAVATTFAITCPGNKKIVTAFHNITYQEPNECTVNLSEPYYIVRRLYPKQTLDGNEIEVKYNGASDIDRDWAVLDVVSPDFTFTETLCLRDSASRLPQTTEKSLMLNTIYYKVGLQQVQNPEFIEATATHPIRVDHVYSKLIEMPTGLYAGASGAPMLDEDNSVVAIHVESISEIDFPNKRVKVSEVASEVSSSHAHSRYGSIIFNLAALRTAIGESSEKEASLK